MVQRIFGWKRLSSLGLLNPKGKLVLSLSRNSAICQCSRIADHSLKFPLQAQMHLHLQLYPASRSEYGKSRGWPVFVLRNATDDVDVAKIQGRAELIATLGSFVRQFLSMEIRFVVGIYS